MTFRSIAVVSAVALTLAALEVVANERSIRAALDAELPGIGIEAITESTFTGLFEVTYTGGVLYASADGRFVLLNARLLDLRLRRNLTERTLSRRRLEVLAEVSELAMINYEPSGKVEHTLTTFTDIDCPYCRKMHAEMDALNAHGIRVRYLLFPRTGASSPSYDKAVSVWCAPDRAEALTWAKSGEEPEKRTCENPIREHIALAHQLGLTGTPFTITDTGRIITGYMPLETLLSTLREYRQEAAR